YARIAHCDPDGFRPPASCGYPAGCSAPRSTFDRRFAHSARGPGASRLRLNGSYSNRSTVSVTSDLPASSDQSTAPTRRTTAGQFHSTSCDPRRGGEYGHSRGRADSALAPPTPLTPSPPSPATYRSPCSPRSPHPSHTPPLHSPPTDGAGAHPSSAPSVGTSIYCRIAETLRI